MSTSTDPRTRCARCVLALALLPAAAASGALVLSESVPVADFDIPAAGTTMSVEALDDVRAVGVSARWTAVTADGGGGTAPWSADLDITVEAPIAATLEWDFVGGEVSIADFPLSDASDTFDVPSGPGMYTWTFDGTPSPYIAGLRDVELHFLQLVPDQTVVVNSTTMGGPTWSRPFSIVGVSGLGPVSYDAIEFTVPVSGRYVLDSVHPAGEDHWASLYEGEFDPEQPLMNQLDYGLGNGFAIDDTPRGTAHIDALLFAGRTYTMVTSQWASFRTPPDYTLTVVGPAEITIAGETCAGDLNADDAVDSSDLAELLAGWGGSGPADLDASGVVDSGDLAILLAAWGECAD